MNEATCIKTYLNRHEAEMDREFLESSGIPAVILAGDLGGILPGLLWGATVRLMVAQDQAGDALELLEYPQQDS
ncbi:MAG: DUF2007 domain-containing protein [Fidelibacterota bacterium]|nr:MAG: DUF2007 domain-containing protein [Candidatus Neomarinimicrobiota bacterium]